MATNVLLTCAQWGCALCDDLVDKAIYPVRYHLGDKCGDFFAFRLEAYCWVYQTRREGSLETPCSVHIEPSLEATIRSSVSTLATCGRAVTRARRAPSRMNHCIPPIDRSSVRVSSSKGPNHIIALSSQCKPNAFATNAYMSAASFTLKYYTPISISPQRSYTKRTAVRWTFQHRGLLSSAHEAAEGVRCGDVRAVWQPRA
jgi:hypothetical protein